MKKRSTLVETTLKRAAAVKGPAPTEPGENVATAIVLPKYMLTLLQDVAKRIITKYLVLRGASRAEIVPSMTTSHGRDVDIVGCQAVRFGEICRGPIDREP